MLLDIVGHLTRMVRDLLLGCPTPLPQRKAGAPEPRLPGRDQLQSAPGIFEGRGMATLVLVAARAASGV